ncbi:type II secretion system protein [Candidatus Saccharibacteria bacterium]|nr:type II secretion system protein [Candidatus Saccharibacteria bacterium]
MLRAREKGDTIIEVLFAIAVFSLIAVGGLSIMNQGTALAQRALEINLVRQQIDTQSEAIRYINQSYVADFGKNGTPTQLWNQVAVNNAVSSAADFDAIVVDGRCVLPAKAFAIDTTKMATNPLLSPTATPATYSKIRYDAPLPRAEGIWVQAVKRSGTGFYDFHIRACWDSPGRSSPMTLGTIVRLYEPAG